ncbi:MAG: hypothetical protein ACKO9D_00665 [Gammaproteobacteria bacterium]
MPIRPRRTTALLAALALGLVVGAVTPPVVASRRPSASRRTSRTPTSRR